MIYWNITERSINRHQKKEFFHYFPPLSNCGIAGHCIKNERSLRGRGRVDGKSISDGLAPLPKGERSPTKKHQCMAKKAGRTQVKKGSH
jgi:hypothetical protein